MCDGDRLSDYGVITDGCECAVDRTFQQEPCLEAASTQLVSLSGSRLPGPLMRDARVDGPLRLTGYRSDQPVRLTRAHVTGTADLSHVSLSGAPALHTDSLVVERDLLCRDATIRGGLLMGRTLTPS